MSNLLAEDATRVFDEIIQRQNWDGFPPPPADEDHDHGGGDGDSENRLAYLYVVIAGSILVISLLFAAVIFPSVDAALLLAMSVLASPFPFVAAVHLIRARFH